ncbi:MAG: hypothetical protein LRY73_03470 [Bacillus sp. (in: Bacteria)]|nr:hypothetical protein [Bacillus sp. (in: firmicutes)]
MDGNGRWGKQRGFSRSQGHYAGSKNDGKNNRRFLRIRNKRTDTLCLFFGKLEAAKGRS